MGLADIRNNTDTPDTTCLCKVGRLLADPASFGLSEADGDVDWLKDQIAMKAADPRHDSAESFAEIATRIRLVSAAAGSHQTLSDKSLQRHCMGHCRR